MAVWTLYPALASTETSKREQHTPPDTEDCRRSRTASWRWRQGQTNTNRARTYTVMNTRPPPVTASRGKVVRQGRLTSRLERERTSSVWSPGPDSLLTAVSFLALAIKSLHILYDTL